MSRGTVTFLLGLRGVGKTYFRKTDSTYKDHIVIDLKPLYDLCPSEMDKYEKPTYVKVLATAKLAEAVSWHNSYENVVVECTGSSKTSQAFIAGLIKMVEDYGYETELIYLRPTSIPAFKTFIRDNTEAKRMFNDVCGKHVRWRRPDTAPYLSGFNTININHDEVMQDQEYLEAARERLEGARVAQGG